MLTPSELAALKRKAHQANYGSRYVSLEELAAVIEAYEAVCAERDALVEAVKGWLK